MIVGSVPDIPATPCATLSTMTAPIAPAFWAFLTFTVKLQAPRSMRAIRPPALDVIGLQPSVAAPESPATSWPLTFCVESCGPKSALPIGYAPAAPAGAVTRRRGRLPMYAFAYTAPLGPFHWRFPVFVDEASRSASVTIWSHVFPAVVSRRKRSKIPGNWLVPEPMNAPVSSAADVNPRPWPNS